MNVLKGIAILFMVILHLFCTKEVNGLYETFPTIDGVPFVYYLALFGDACVPIYCFASGYGLFLIYNSGKLSIKNNFNRIFRLLINFWIVLILFVLIGYIAGKGALYPGSTVKFIKNFFILSSSYNGAWWFLQTYVILVLLSPSLMKIVSKYHSIFLIICTGLIYLLSYVERIKNIVDLSDFPLLNSFMHAIVLVGTSLLPFIVGSLFAKERIYSKIYNLVNKLRFKNIICIFGILCLVLLHSFYQSMIIAPITAILFICFFSLLNKSVQIQMLLKYLSAHSTNIWLTHMFFYMNFFPSLVFYPRYPLLIFVWLIILCLISSYIINLINNPIIQLYNQKLATLKNRRINLNSATANAKDEFGV
ncbi:acyltransferase family protein [Paenibacillus castaneae]|nr:acyltransferase [Paenibacillus castaneae]